VGTAAATTHKFVLQRKLEMATAQLTAQLSAQLTAQQKFLEEMKAITAVAMTKWAIRH
jgi:hypothetical protein